MFLKKLGQLKARKEILRDHKIVSSEKKQLQTEVESKINSLDEISREYSSIDRKIAA